MAQRDLIKTYNLTLMKWISNVALTETLEPVKKKKSKPWAQPLAQSFMTTCKTSPKFWKFSWYSMVFHFLPAKAIVPEYISWSDIKLHLYLKKQQNHLFQNLMERIRSTYPLWEAIGCIDEYGQFGYWWIQWTNRATILDSCKQHMGRSDECASLKEEIINHKRERENIQDGSMS